jgi:LytS/YehU family sensor histidine kinase
MNISNVLEGSKTAGWFLSLSESDTLPLLRQLWRGIYFIGFSSAYWFVLRAIYSEKKVLQLEKMQMINQVEKNNLEKNYVEMQNAFLQSQINPHLLFNTLNFIYNDVQHASPDASETVLLLAELMSYSLRETESDGKVSLEKEIIQIRNIIRINQIRFNKKLYLDTEFNGDFSNARIIPLALIPFVENIFKHANLTDENNPGKITVDYNGTCVELVTLNKKKMRKKAFSHGIGVVNVTKRLNNLYRNNYSLDIKNEEQDYYLRLIINLNSIEK